jgi:hypothetical protein
MQSQLLALPVSLPNLYSFSFTFYFLIKNNEHAELVYKLRLLLERANTINVDCSHKLLNSSKTLQIIQSRLELRQQQYAAVLLQQNKEAALKLSLENKQIDLTGVNSSEFLRLTRQNSKLSYLSDDEYNTVDDDQESFVSATSVRQKKIMIRDYFAVIKGHGVA